jgi:hypothetical protein
MENKIRPTLPTGFSEIVGASDYGLSPDNYVHNLNTGRKLKRYWANVKYVSTVVDDNGVKRKYNHSMAYVDRPTISEEELDRMRLIADYPDYKVTHFGAVWKFRKTGRRHNNKPFLVGTKQMHDKEYIRLKTEDGRAHWVRMEKIMEDTYSEH